MVVSAHHPTGSAVGAESSSHIHQQQHHAEADQAMIGLEDALGMPQLAAALASIREVIGWVRESPRSRMELENTLRRLEGEKARLQKELAASESKGEERLVRLREELQAMQLQLSELRRNESMGHQASKQIAALESALAQEREDKQKALNTAEKVREECDSLARDLALAQQDLGALRTGPSQV